MQARTSLLSLFASFVHCVTLSAPLTSSSRSPEQRPTYSSSHTLPHTSEGLTPLGIRPETAPLLTTHQCHPFGCSPPQSRALHRCAVHDVFISSMSQPTLALIVFFCPSLFFCCCFFNFSTTWLLSHRVCRPTTGDFKPHTPTLGQSTHHLFPRPGEFCGKHNARLLCF